MHYEVTARREAGESIADIADSLSVNESTLGRWFWSLDVRLAASTHGRSQAPNPWKPWARDDAVAAYTRTNLPIAERAAMLGRSYTAVAGIVHDYGRELPVFGDEQFIAEVHKILPKL